MNIEDYTGFFHDGSIIDIKHEENEIEISMESAEMTEEDMKEEFPLSEHDTIKGKLHLEGIKNIKENDKINIEKLKMNYEIADIFDFEISQNKVQFKIKWNSFPPSQLIKGFSTIQIEAEKIWWENIPDLYDPYW